MTLLTIYLSLLLIVTAISNDKSYYYRHSEYASRVAASKKKFLPRSLFNSPNTNKNKLADVNELECKIRTLALQYANQIQPFRDQSATSDALDIARYCGPVQSKPTQPNKPSIYRSNAPIQASEYMVYVDPINGNDNNNGDETSPFKTIYKALDTLRSYKSNDAIKQLIIRKGTVYLTSTVNLSPTTFDNNLLIRAYPNENVTISGGIHLKIDSLHWQRYNDGNASHNIWMTAFDESFANNLFNQTILSLFTLTPHTRLTRARFPNGHAEVWGNGAYYINPYWVNEWYLPAQGMQYAPDQIFKDLSNCSSTSPCMNKSHDKAFDTYTAGYGKLCDRWTPSYNYWCGKNCGGGWGDQDQRQATKGIQQLPVGLLYNTSLLPEIAAFGDSMATAVFYIHHSQGWNVFWWEIGGEYDLLHGNISLGHGGFQGGRVWTKTHDLNQNAVTNLPIMAGSWFIENVFAALDAETEWFYDRKERILYYWPNNTVAGQSPVDTKVDLVIANLAHLFALTGDGINNPLLNVSFLDIEFRDTRSTYLDKEWAAPSGGDWALYRYGAFYFENTSNCSISSSSFLRLDGNCIALYGYNRHTTFYRNEFGWIGDNVIGAWGKTQDDDGTDGQQPRFTNVIQNIVHDIGLYQLQSSLFFSGKSCQNYLYANIVYNIPRAAILFNDAFGGGTAVISNLIFNTCTQSGDHGPINSWNRVPYLTKLAHGTPSYDSLYNNISSNFVFANYGGSQAFDTDDGSAWQNIEANFFYDAMAYKNDYGGFNVNFINNINVVFDNGESSHSSWGIGAVNSNGPGNTIYGNKIIIYQCRGNTSCETNGQIWDGGNLNNNGVLKLHNNDYYTPLGNAAILTNQAFTLKQMYQQYGLCNGSTANLVPTVDQIVVWAKELLQMDQ